jgi:hypothetical protein
MAVTTTGQYAAPFLQPLGSLLGEYTAGELTRPQDITGLLPRIAGTNPLQQQALQQQATQAGLGALQFNQQGQLTGAGQGTGIAGYEPYLQGAAQLSGPQAYQQYMSPYQQDIINTTLQNYDIQAQKGLAPLAANAIQSGAFGGAREGIQRAEYQSASDRNRAALEAQLRQSGFNTAQGLAQTGFGQQYQLANLQPQLAYAASQQLGQAGTAQQGYEQNILNALQQGNVIQNQYGIQRLGGITDIFNRLAQATPASPGQPILTNPALAGSQAFAGIYGAMNPKYLYGGTGTNTGTGRPATGAQRIWNGVKQVYNDIKGIWETNPNPTDTNPPIDEPQAGDSVYTDYGQNAGDSVYTDYPENPIYDYSNAGDSVYTDYWW